jgi:hypothetical protein
MKSYTIPGITLVLIVVVWAAGCGVAPTAVAPGDGGVNNTQSQSVETTRVKEATMTPLPTTEPAEVEPPPEAERVVQLAREDLAQRLGLAPDAMRLVSVEAVDWSDASLGCPQPGMMYAQVITPGFRVVLEANGEEYDYHTDRDHSVVLCEDGDGTSGTTGGET